MSTKPEKTKVVLDTNIVVSALIGKHGAPAKIFEKILLDKIENYTSTEILAEMENVFNRKEITERTSKEDRTFILSEFKTRSKILHPKTKIKAVIEDTDDDKFLEAALEAKVHYIISGDQHLTKLKTFRGIHIVTPKEFIERV